MNIYLRTYQLPRMVNPFVDRCFKTVSIANHCAIRTDTLVVHFFDEDPEPRWITPEADYKWCPYFRELHIGRTEYGIRNFKKLVDNLPMPSYYNKQSRYYWFLSCGLWPKRRDCVDNCSKILTELFNFPRCYLTPDRLMNNAKDWKRRIRGTD